MQKENIIAKKELGQNFLKDNNIARKIVGLLDNNLEQRVIEIGPGMGALTEYLLLQNRQIIAVDKDNRALEYLHYHYNKSVVSGDLSLVGADILSINLNDYGSELNKVAVIGNIPYNITNDILFWLFDNYRLISCVVLMIQREVALRYIAKPRTKDYGITTLALELFSSVRKVFDVSPDCFVPKPKVVSSVITIDFDKEVPVNSSDLLFLIRASFSQRRKVLNNSLKVYFNNKKINVDSLHIYLDKIGCHYLKQRAEELILSDYIKLLSYIEENN